nr:transglycosylase domain-containing protein [Lachnospiraceae bacterium]
MDFGRFAVKKKLKTIKSTSVRLSSKTRVTSLRLILIMVVFVIAIGIFAVVGAVQGIIASSPSIDNINVIPSGYATNIYYSDGSLAQTLIAAGGNREYAYIANIPKVVQDAFIAIEDERFWEHEGIDARSIFRSVVEILASGKPQSGASTITQQLLKNQIFGGGNETKTVPKVIRKIQEQYLAIKMENAISKETILEYYLNTINLGQGAYGIKKAAQVYFGKELDELTLSEAAVLACIPKSPTYYNPYKYPEDNARRRTTVLNRMKNQGLITEAEYNEAIEDTEDVYARIKYEATKHTSSSVYSYFTDEVISQLVTDFQTQYGYTAAEASQLIYAGGLSIYTTQDRKIQDIADSVTSNESYYPAFGGGSYYELAYAISILKKDGTTIHYHLSDLIKHNDGFKYDLTISVRITSTGYNLMYYNKTRMDNYIEKFKDSIIEDGDKILLEKRSDTVQPQLSVSIIDQSTGAVVALVGGRGEKSANRTLNRATTSLRQTGSTFKILAVYLAALDSGKFTLATPMDDSPYFYPDSVKEVANWYTKFYGLTPIRRAISYSMNIIAVKTLADITPEFGYSY